MALRQNTISNFDRRGLDLQFNVFRFSKRGSTLKQAKAILHHPPKLGR